jgi:hypothetical protein
MRDHDFDLENNAVEVLGAEPSKTYKHHSIGPALVWIPLYAVGDLLSRLSSRPADGWNVMYRSAVAYGSLVVGWSGLVALYLAARPLAGSAAALLAALGIGGGTFLFGYLAWWPSTSHGLAFAASAWLMFAALRSRPQSPGSSFGLGVLLGIAALQRWQAFVLGVILVVPLLRNEPRDLRSVSTRLAAGALGAVVAFFPQALFWKVVFGEWLTVPQGAGFLSGSPEIEGVLFGPRHGLFSWSPILLLALGGFLPWLRRDVWTAAAALVAIAATLRTNASLVDWWGGSAFGGRRFDVVLPLFGIALAYVCAASRAWIERLPLAGAAFLLALLTGWNVFFAEAYFRGRLPMADAVPFSAAAHATIDGVDARFGNPFSLPAAIFRRWRDGTPLASFENRHLDRLYSTLVIRMDVDDRLFLEDGWSAPYAVSGTATERGDSAAGTYRRLRGVGASVILPLHAPRDSRLGLRARAQGSEASRYEIWLNGRRIQQLTVTPMWTSFEIDAPAAAFVAGRNRLRINAADVASEGRLLVQGFWVDPRAAQE